MLLGKFIHMTKVIQSYLLNYRLLSECQKFTASEKIHMVIFFILIHMGIFFS